MEKTTSWSYDDDTPKQSYFQTFIQPHNQIPIFPRLFFHGSIVTIDSLYTLYAKKYSRRGVCESQKFQEGGVHFAEKLCTSRSRLAWMMGPKKIIFIRVNQNRTDRV